MEEGEKWYLEVHSHEAKEQPGLLRYVSHRVLENPPIVTPWHLVTEMWYEDFDAWRKAVIDSPPKHTPPSWRKEEPFPDMISTKEGTSRNHKCCIMKEYKPPSAPILCLAAV